MANQYYELINTPTIEIDGRVYVAQTFNSNLSEFLKANAGKRIWILDSSVQSDRIRAIVI